MSDVPEDDSLKIHGYTAADIVKRYIELRDEKLADSKAFKETIKEYDDSMEVLEGAAALLMKKTEQTRLTTEFGTAFPQDWQSYRVTDPALWHAWVRETQHWDMYTNHVSQDAMELHLEATKIFVAKDPNGNAIYRYTLPPGITCDSGTDIKFRRSS